MRRLIVGVAIFGMLFMSITTWAGDRDIAEQIIKQLKVHRESGALKEFDIDLKVNKGIVLVKGEISSPAQRSLILQAAKSASGVKDIVDELKMPSKKAAGDGGFVNPSLAAKPKAAESKPKAPKSAAVAAKQVKPAPKVVRPETIVRPAKPVTQLASALELIESDPRAIIAKPKSQPILVNPLATAAPKKPSREDLDRKLNIAITQAITKAKNEGRLRGFAMDITTNVGDVWLQGRTLTEEQRDIVLTIVKSVPGVNNVVDDISVVMPTRVEPVAITEDSMVRHASDQAPAAANVPVPPANLPTIPTRPIRDPVVQATPQPLAPGAVQQVPVTQAAPVMQRAPARLVRVPYRRNAMPQPFAPASTGMVAHGATMAAHPVPMQAGAGGVAYGAPRYDQPNLPNYAWPGYSAYPNYAALAYPKQYSPSAWPYIGPFYPYPQVPLNWRKVTLEWDDGWWFLDYSSKSR